MPSKWDNIKNAIKSELSDATVFAIKHYEGI